MAGRPPVASVVIVTWNSREDLPVCLASLKVQSQPGFEVIVVDNGSTDGTVAYVKQAHPWVRVHQTGYNAGYATANNAGFAIARGGCVIVLNPDTEVEPDFINGLVEAVNEEGVGLATSRICLFNHRNRINACGNDMHVSGLGFCRGLDQPSHRFEKCERVPAVSGCAFGIRRDVLEKIGGFDEDYFTYAEDSDISLRAALAGYAIAYAPRSIVYHRYALRMNPQKFYYLERNRRLNMIKNLRWRTLVALSPALFATSFAMWLYALLHGGAYLGAKWRASSWIYGNWSQVLEKRRRTQALRKVGDRRIVRLLTSALPPDQVIGTGRAGRALGVPVNLVYRLLTVPARIFG